MANLDYTIASGIRPIQVESPQNQLAQAYQLKGMQEASQMNALKMQEMQRGVEQKNRLRTALSGVDINSPEANKLIEQAYLQEGDFGGLMAHRKSMAEMNKEQIGQEKAKSDLFDAKLKQSRQFLEGLDVNSPTAVPDFIKWHEANHKDEVLGPILAQRGVTLQSSRARIEQAIKSGRIADLIDESKLGIEKFAELSPNYKKQKAEEADRDYSDYLGAVPPGEKALPRSNPAWRDFINQRRASAAPVVSSGNAAVAAPVVVSNAAAPAAGGAVVDTMAMFSGNVPQIQRDANGTVVQPVNMASGVEQRPLVTAPDAAPVVSDVAAPVATSNIKMVNGVPVSTGAISKESLDPEVTRLINSPYPADKEAGKLLQQKIENEKRAADSRSPLGQLHFERSALSTRLEKETNLSPADKKRIKSEIRDYDERIRIEKTRASEANQINAVNRDLIALAVSEGRLDPYKITSRNEKIITSILEKDPKANLTSLNIDAVSQTKVAKDFASGIEARQVKSFNTAIDHLDTLDKLADALANKDMRLFNLASNRFAKETGAPAPGNFETAVAIVGGEVAKALTGSNMALEDRKKIREQIQSSASPAQLKGVMATLKQLLGGQLNSLNTQYEAGAGRQDFDKWLSPASKRELQKLRGESSGAAPPPVDGVLKPEVKTLLDKYK